MRLIVADTSPIRYLVRIGHIDLLPCLFERIFIPSVVAEELRHPSAPLTVQDWMNCPPEWLEISVATDTDDPALLALWILASDQPLCLVSSSRPISCRSMIAKVQPLP